MKIEMNKDFEEQYKSTYKGLTGSEVTIAAIALAISGSIVFAVWRFTDIPVNAAVYLGIPVMIPIVAIGFYKFQGSSVLDLIRAISYLRNTRKLGCDLGEFDESRLPRFTMCNKLNHSGKQKKRRR